MTPIRRGTIGQHLAAAGTAARHVQPTIPFITGHRRGPGTNIGWGLTRRAAGHQLYRRDAGRHRHDPTTVIFHGDVAGRFSVGRFLLAFLAFSAKDTGEGHAEVAAAADVDVKVERVVGQLEEVGQGTEHVQPEGEFVVRVGDDHENGGRGIAH